MPFVFECVISIAPAPSLGFFGASLPTAIMGEPYVQFIAPQAVGGIAPLTFTLVSDVGNGVFATDSTGLITGIPTPSAVQITDTGAYIVDENGNLMVT